MWERLSIYLSVETFKWLLVETVICMSTKTPTVCLLECLITFCLWKHLIVCPREHWLSVCENIWLSVCENSCLFICRNINFSVCETFWQSSKLCLCIITEYIWCFKDGTSSTLFSCFLQWGSVNHQMEVPVPSISCCVFINNDFFLPGAEWASF